MNKSIHATSILSVRVDHKLKDKFRKKAERYGTPSEVHKELIEGFVEDRVSLTRKPKPIDKLYGENDES